MILLNHYIPESPRFLLRCGRIDQARPALRRFGGSKSVLALDTRLAPAASAPQIAFDLLRRQRGIMTIALILGAKVPHFDTEFAAA